MYYYFDYVGGNLEIKEKIGCMIVGFKGEVVCIFGIDIELQDGDMFEFG